MDDPVRQVDVRAAELLLGHPFPDCPLDEGGAADEDLGVPGHDGEVGRAKACGRHARDRPDSDRGHRSRLEGAGHGNEAVAGEHGLAGRPPLSRAGYRPAPALVEADEGKLELEGEVLDVDALAKPGGIGRPAPQGEVLASDDDRAAVDPARSDHVVRGGEADEPTRIVVFRLARPFAVLPEGVGVKQPVDPLADGREAAPALPCDAFRAALRLGVLTPLVDLLDFGPPVRPLRHCCWSAPASPGDGTGEPGIRWIGESASPAEYGGPLSSTVLPSGSST